MTLFEHLQEARDRFIKSSAVVIGISLFSFVFSFKTLIFEGVTLVRPSFSISQNLASQFIERIKDDMLPDYVTLVVLSPSQAIVSQIYMAIFIGLVIGMPFLVYQTLRFISPGLYPEEQKLFVKLIAPATFLFLFGAGFSYYFVAPFSLEFLYRYAAPLDADTFITISGMISFVLRFIFGFGIAFQLPIFMWALTKIGVVPASYWKNNLRYAFVIMIVFGAVVTPDGSGVTMWLVAGPMMFLYVLGYWFVNRKFPQPDSSDLEVIYTPDASNKT
jgi:sec-independent protein translocase protein TatC